MNYYTNPNDSCAKVDSTSAGGQKVGPNLLLKVMSGDTVNLSVQCFYNSPGGGSTNNSSFSDVLNSLSNGLVNLTGGEHGTLANLTASNSTVFTGLTSFLDTNDIAHTGYPKAYINWIFLDDQFNYLSSLSGSVLAASSTYPAGSLNMVAPGGPIALNKSGYLYIWVSNETTGWDVYYDNLSVQYKQGPLLEENHYYPFGLTMAGISDKAIKTNYSENKYRYNAGTELQNKEFSDGTGLEMYETGFRMLDPQLGRFTQVDQLADMDHFLSVYQYANNNPVSVNDPTGLLQQYQSGPTPQGPSYYNNSDNFGLPTIGQINQAIQFYDGMPSSGNASSGGGSGMYLGGGAYQLPNGDVVDQTTAINFAMNTFGGTSTTYYGWQAQLIVGVVSGQIGVTNKTVYNYTKFDGSTSFQTDVDHGQFTFDRGANDDLYYFVGTSVKVMADGEDLSTLGHTTSVSDIAGNVAGVVGLTSDLQATVWTGGKILLKNDAKLLKPFTGPATAIGAVVGIGTAGYDLIYNKNPNYWKDGGQIALGLVAGAAELFGVGEVWDWIGFGASAISTGIDVYDMAKENK
jgi:RHS repeat-associated protein